MIAAADYDAACWIVDHGSTKDGTTPENGFANQASTVIFPVLLIILSLRQTTGQVGTGHAWRPDTERRM